MKKEYGFTAIEISVIIAILLIIGIFFLLQRNNLESTTRDQQRKIAINSMYYGLKEVFYKENKFYPTSISSENLKSVDPKLFEDMNGVKIGDIGSEYFYEGINCDMNGKCKSFKLIANMEKEAVYIREI